MITVRYWCGHTADVNETRQAPPKTCPTCGQRGYDVRATPPRVRGAAGGPLKVEE